jgi:hypothetical protein
MPKIAIYLKINFDGYEKIGPDFKNQKGIFNQWIPIKPVYRIMGASVRQLLFTIVTFSSEK